MVKSRARRDERKQDAAAEAQLDTLPITNHRELLPSANEVQPSELTDSNSGTTLSKEPTSYSKARKPVKKLLLADIPEEVRHLYRQIDGKLYHIDQLSPSFLSRLDRAEPTGIRIMPLNIVKHHNEGV